MCPCGCTVLGWKTNVICSQLPLLTLAVWPCVWKFIASMFGCNAFKHRLYTRAVSKKTCDVGVRRTMKACGRICLSASFSEGESVVLSERKVPPAIKATASRRTTWISKYAHLCARTTIPSYLNYTLLFRDLKLFENNAPPFYHGDGSRGISSPFSHMTVGGGEALVIAVWTKDVNLRL
jgi:hypothetical protein